MSIVLMALLFSLMPFAKTMADDIETVHLKNVTDWERFVSRVIQDEVTLNAVMDNDIDLGDCQKMIGSGDAYQGIFDGNGHTLTVGYNGEKAYCAPFVRIDGATIKNLIVKGKMRAKYNKGNGGAIIGGIVSTVEYESRTSNISNCAVYAELHSDDESGTPYIGGFIGYAQTSVNIDNCLFAGIIADNSKAEVSCSKLIGCLDLEGEDNIVISNTLLSGKSTNNTDWYNITATNVYEYEETEANRLPENIAKQVTADQLTSGELAVLLNKNNNNPVWGQVLGSDASPIPNGVKVVEEKSTIKEATTYHITNGTNWRTLIYPKDTEAGKDLRIFTVSGVNNDNVLVFNELESGNILANTPVILYKNPEATDATTGFTLQPYDYRNEAPTTGYLRGVYTTTAAPVGSYVLQKHAGQTEPAFYKVADKQPNVKPYNCYLEVEQSSNAKSFSFPFFDTTGIQGVQTNNVLNFGDGKIYTLDGKQVSHMEKGVIYIMNGKKFIIK